MKNPSIAQIFAVFAKIGSFTIGGGYAMIPLIEDEIRRRGWIEENEMDDIVVLAQAAPGLLAVNMAIFTGRRLRGLKGSVAAAAGAVLPSFVIILLIAMAFTTFKENSTIRSFFQGMRPVAVALILVPAINMARKGIRNWWTAAIAALTLAAVVIFKLSPVWIIITVLAAASLVGAITGRK